jgi:hypothetical protein
MANGKWSGQVPVCEGWYDIQHLFNEVMNLILGSMCEISPWFWKLIFIDMNYTEYFRFVSEMLCSDGGRLSYTRLSENLIHPFKPFSCFLQTVYYKIIVPL